MNPINSSDTNGAGRRSRTEVLVIDDQAEVRDLIGLILARLNRPVRLAATGAEARVVLAEHAATVALALVDIVLPDVDGLSLAREMRNKYPGVKVVLLSGKLDEESRWVVSEDGFRFLPKPFPVAALADLVNEHVGDIGPETKPART